MYNTGDAVNQIRGVLGYPTGSNIQPMWEERITRMLSNARGQCIVGEWGGVCDSAAPLLLLQIDNSVWFDDGGTLDPGYEVDIGSFPKQIDLEADDSPVIVNEWVKNQTNGMIGLIVPEDKPLYNTGHGNSLQSTRFISKHHETSFP